MGIYSKGKATDLTGFSWYHGNITEAQADLALSTYSYNSFLVRESGHNLVLSNKLNGWKSHVVIHRSPAGYCLQGKKLVFRTVSEMISHYQQFPLGNDQVLGNPVDKLQSGIALILISLYPGVYHVCRRIVHGP